MKILIVSDTHRRDGNLQTVIEKTAPFDMLIHLGDAEGSEDRIETWCREQNENCQVHMILGNNDFFSDLPREEEFCIGTYKVFITHGHAYYVSLDPEYIREEGKARKADIVMFGHTHRPYFEEKDGIIILNPGSLSFPRQGGRKGSYMIMELNEDKSLHFQQKYLD